MDKLNTLESLKQKIAAELDRRPAEERDAALAKVAARNRLKMWFPDEGPLRRELYAKHVQFLNAGATEHERLFIAANRVGKSETGAYEAALHLTGRYPHWWQGKRFSGPIKLWAAGETSKKVREVVQEKLFGPPNAIGTGMIPADAILDKSMRAGTPDAIDFAWIRYVSGGASHVTLKTYEQGREAFDGDAVHVIWLDEEPELPIYTESLLRTMTTKGIVYLTFTPLQGISDVVKQFLYPEQGQQKKFYINATWNDAPHLDEETRKKYFASIPPHQRKARTEGVPDLGAGVIYPIAESEITVQNFRIPDHWPRAYGLDTGWNWTAAVWGARDRESDVVYIYDVYKRGQAEPPVHAEAIKSRGTWIRGVGDAADINRYDGQQFLKIYQKLGLLLQLPDKRSVEANIHEVWTRLATGRLKIFESCVQWFDEFRLYRRDENGKIVRENDHLMASTQYLCKSGLALSSTKPEPRTAQPPRKRIFGATFMGN
jgi:phage terminase large subunit-like protein